MKVTIKRKKKVTQACSLLLKVFVALVALFSAVVGQEGGETAKGRTCSKLLGLKI